MKDRNFAVIDTYRFPPFWLVNIIDSDGRCRPYGYRSTMSMCVLGGNFNLSKSNNEEVHDDDEWFEAFQKPQARNEKIELLLCIYY